MNNNYYSDLRAFDQDGHRYSIFGKEKDGKLEVFIIRCNKLDQFDRAVANTVYKAFEDDKFCKLLLIDKDYYHPFREIVEIEKGNSAQYTFRQYVKNKFYKKGKMKVELELDVLYKKDGVIYPKIQAKL